MSEIAPYRDLVRAIRGAPHLPTIFPADVDPEALCRVADLMAQEGYAAIEVLCRPFETAMELLGEVFARPQRRAVFWGIGTLKGRSDAQAAAALKPDFLVSAAFSQPVFEVALAHDISYFPGFETIRDAQEILEIVQEAGRPLELLKLCPCWDARPLYLAALGQIFPGVAFCPSGDVALHNYVHYLQMPNMCAPMGADLVPRPYFQKRDFDAIQQRLRVLKIMAQEVERCREGGA